MSSASGAEAGDDRGWHLRRLGYAPTPAPPVDPRVPWDEAARPSAPEPGPDVVFPAPPAGQHLVQVHDHFRAELDRVHDVLAQVREGRAGVGAARDAVQQVALRADSWVVGGICQRYCLGVTQHHTLEDGAVFPGLAAHQPDLAPVLGRLRAEHVVIHDLIEGVDAALVALAGQPGDLAAVDEAVRVLSAALLSHFSYEERELVGPLSRYGFG